MFRRPLAIFAVLLGLAALSSGALQAATSWFGRMNYQGQLTDNLGEPVADGNYNLIFRMYNQDSGGTSFWNETQLVTVNKGLFNVVLGTITPIDTMASINNLADDIWLGIEVSGDGEMSPRQQLLTSAYAYNARFLEGASLGTSAYNIVQLDNNAKIPAGLIDGGSVGVPLLLSGVQASYILRANNAGTGMAISATTASGTVPAIYGEGSRYGGYFKTNNDISGVALQAASTNGYAALINRSVDAQVYGLATTTSTLGVRGENSNAGGTGTLGLGGLTGVSGVATANLVNATGVFGSANGTTAQVYGVRGQVSSTHPSAAGVYGRSTVGSAVGVHGESTVAGGAGVRATGLTYGILSNATEYGMIASGRYGVYAEAGGSNGAALYGYTENSTSPAVVAQNGDVGPALYANAWDVAITATAGTVGIYSIAQQDGGVAGRFIASGPTLGSTGIHASTNSTAGYAGRFAGGSRAVVAEGATIGVSATGSTMGLFAQGTGSYGAHIRSTNYDGLRVESTSTSGYYGIYSTGSSMGILAEANNTGASGVYGQSNGANSRGVYGQSTGAGGYGIYGYSSNSNGYGVYGSAGGATSYGVYGSASTTGSYGIYGTASSAAAAAGVYGIATGSSAWGVYGRATGAGSYAVLGDSATSAAAGVRGQSSVSGGRGVEGVMTSTGTTGYGGYFSHAGTSSAAYGIRVDSEGSGIDVKASQYGITFDQTTAPLYGMRWYNFQTNVGNGNFAVYAYNYCYDCRAGLFSNTSATASTSGYALRAEGQVFMPNMSLRQSMSGVTSLVVNNAYVASTAVITLTPDRDIGVGNRYWVESISNGTFTMRIATAVTGLIMHYHVFNR